MSTQTASSVVFRNVQKHFGNFTALHDLSLEIEPGTLVTLLGPSGCGKTTTLRLLAGLEHPTSGQILIGGKDVTKLPANERDVSMVFQSYALFPHMTVLENVEYGLRSSGMAASDVRGRAEEGLAQVGLTGYGNRLPSELSGGQQQRVAVARALVLQPKVLLLDEPLSNLDARLRRHMRSEIRELQQKLGLTAVYVTHDQEEALAVSDRIIVMDKGKIAQQGSPRELYEQPASRFIADFIGEANILKCDVLRSENGRTTVRIGAVVHTVSKPAAVTGNALMAVRPNAITLGPVTNGGLLGNVRHQAYLGDHMEYEVETEAGTLFVVDSDVTGGLAPATSVGVQFHDRGIAIIGE